MFIPWWVLALVPAAVGIALASRVKPSGGPIDLSGIVAFPLFACGVLCTVCLFIGHWL